MGLILVGLAGWVMTTQAGFNDGHGLNDGHDAPVDSYGIHNNNPNVTAYVNFLARQIEERRKATGNLRQVRVERSVKAKKLNYIANKIFIVMVVLGTTMFFMYQL